MKKVILNVSTLLLFIVNMTMSFQAEAFTATTEVLADKKLVVNLADIYGSKVNCKIIDANGLIIYREIVETTSQIAKKYDLSQLANGDYTLVLDDEMSVERISFTLTDDSIEYTNETPSVIFKPTIKKLGNKKVALNLLSLGQDVQITVTDQDNVVYSDTIEGASTVRKTLTFKGQPRKDYRIEVKVGQDTFYETVRI